MDLVAGACKGWSAARCAGLAVMGMLRGCCILCVAPDVAGGTELRSRGLMITGAPEVPPAPRLPRRDPSVRSGMSPAGLAVTRDARIVYRVMRCERRTVS